MAQQLTERRRGKRLVLSVIALHGILLLFLFSARYTDGAPVASSKEGTSTSSTGAEGTGTGTVTAEATKKAAAADATPTSTVAATAGTAAATPTPTAAAATKTKKKYSPVKVSAQGAQFCQALVQSLSYCPAVETVDSIRINKYMGKWFVIGASAQRAFSVFGPQGGQCVTAEYTRTGQVKGYNRISVHNRALVFSNPLREVEAIVVSQNAGSVALSIRYLCQFLEGQDPISQVIPELLLLSNASSNVAAATNLQAQFDDAYTAAARSVLGDDPLMQVLQQDTYKTAVQSAVKQMASSNPALNNPTTLSSIRMLNSYATSAGTALDTSVAVKGLSNAISIGAMFSSLQERVKGRLGTLTATMTAAVATISMYSEQIYAALERLQRSNLILSATYDAASANVTAAGISAQASRINWLARRMEAERKKLYRASLRVQDRIKALKDSTLNEAAAGITTLSQPLGPIAVAINQTMSACSDIITVLGQFSITLSVPRRVDVKGVAYQNPQKRGNFTMRLGLDLPYNIIRLTGRAEQGYDMALVWGCSRSFEKGLLPENDFMILSRKRNVPQSAITSALGFLRDNGILLGGANVFLKLTQDFKTCNPVIAISL